MSHKFSFKVSVETNRESGKFATRDEQADSLRDAIEGADPGYLSGLGDYGDSEYTVDLWEVEDDDSDERIKKLRDRIRDLERIIEARDKRIASRDREIIKLSHGK